MFDLYTKFVSNVIFPLHEKLKSHTTVSVRKQMEETQWLSVDEVERQQAIRLTDFLVKISEEVPYYKVLFKKIDFKPQSVNKVSTLEQLPFLTKEIIRDNFEKLKSDTASNLQRFNTGGSSGSPLVFLLGNERVSHDVAAKWRATRWWDVDIGDPEIVVWGSPIELGGQDKVKAIRDKIIRTHLLPAFEMSDTNLKKFIQSIQKTRPKMLFGYPSSISHIALYAEKENIKMSDLGIKVAFVTSEKLYDHQRSAIERVFGCPVANGYGGRDAGFIAHQCPQSGMHITADDIIVEIVDVDGKVLPKGESGEIVVTHMATGEFPFVRYKTGDIGVLDDEICSCGRGLPLLKEIQGRTTDFIIANDGTVMHGLALIYVIRDIDGVENFKITQESLDLTTVQLVTNEIFDEAEINGIIKGFKQRLGESVRIEVERVTGIQKEKSGKFRYVVSHVKTS